MKCCLGFCCFLPQVLKEEIDSKNMPLISTVKLLPLMYFLGVLFILQFDSSDVMKGEENISSKVTNNQ